MAQASQKGSAHNYCCVAGICFFWLAAFFAGLAAWASRTFSGAAEKSAWKGVGEPQFSQSQKGSQTPPNILPKKSTFIK